MLPAGSRTAPPVRPSSPPPPRTAAAPRPRPPATRPSPSPRPGRAPGPRRGRTPRPPSPPPARRRPRRRTSPVPRTPRAVRPVHNGRPAHRVVVVPPPLLAEELQLEPGDLRVELRVGVLRGRSLGARLPGGELLAQPLPRKARRLGRHPQPQQRVVLPRRPQLGPGTPFAGHDPDHPRLAGCRAATDRHPLVHQRGPGDLPPVADRAEPHRVRH